MDMDSKEKIAYAKFAFLEILDNDTRLQRGLQLRKEMWDAVKAGKPTTGYRAEWVRRSGLKIVALLKNIAQDFNNQHSDDRASMHDMLDILAQAKVQLNKKLQK